jgi:hypothetical protein
MQIQDLPEGEATHAAASNTGLPAGAILAITRSMRRRLLLAVVLVILPGVVLAASTLPVSFTPWPLKILEPGSLLLLGITFLILAAIAQQRLSAGRQRESGKDAAG